MDIPATPITTRLLQAAQRLAAVTGCPIVLTNGTRSFMAVTPANQEIRGIDARVPLKGALLREAARSHVRIPRTMQKRQPIKSGERIGRNDPCPCGSGKKFKKCCRNGG